MNQVMLSAPNDVLINEYSPKRLSHHTLSVASIGVAIYGFVLYVFFAPGVSVHPDMRSVFSEYTAGILSHVIPSSIALCVGPLQFYTQLRREHPLLHRLLGYIYFLAVAIGSVAGFYMSYFSALGGFVGKAGFYLLAVLWAISGVRAFYSIAIQKEIRTHELWMYRNFALTFSAVTLRLHLAICLGIWGGGKMSMWYPLLAWSCWVPNLLLLEWYLLPHVVFPLSTQEHVEPSMIAAPSSSSSASTVPLESNPSERHIDSTR